MQYINTNAVVSICLYRTVVLAVTLRILIWVTQQGAHNDKLSCRSWHMKPDIFSHITAINAGHIGTKNPTGTGTYIVILGIYQCLRLHWPVINKQRQHAVRQRSCKEVRLRFYVLRCEPAAWYCKRFLACVVEVVCWDQASNCSNGVTCHVRCCWRVPMELLVLNQNS